MEVSGFEIRGNTLLTAAVLQRVLEPFKGRVTADDLKAAAQAVQKRYAAQGYGGVAAYVPVQQRGDGIVTIAVLEGKLARVDVVGAPAGNAESIKASLPALAVGATPHLKTLDLQIQMVNENPAKQVRVLLKPGAQQGEIAAEVGVQEGPKQRVTLGVDNSGNERTGHYRASASWQHANVSGKDDVLTALYQTSPTNPSKVTVLSAAYRRPFYSRLTFLDAYLAYSDVDGGTTATAAGDLRFNGSGHLAGLRATRLLPRWGEADQRLSLGLDYREYLNRCDIVGLPVGACGPAGASVAVQPLSLEYSVQKGGARPFGLSASLNRNLQLGGRHSSNADFEAVRPGAQPRYTALRYAASAALPIAETWQLRGRLSGQFSANALVPAEQFGVAGASSVRGYEEREITGDTGLLGSVELASPPLLAASNPGDPVVQLLGFLDAGQVTNRSGTPCLGLSTRCTLASWGAGSRLELGKLQARLYLASALRDAARTEKGDLRAHLSANYTF